MTDQAQFVSALRKDALNSLYFFAKVVCGFKDFTPGLHKDLCDFMQTDQALRKIMLVPVSYTHLTLPTILRV